MKKILLSILFSCFAILSIAETVATAPTLGNGSEENPYEIENLAHLRWLS